MKDLLLAAIVGLVTSGVGSWLALMVWFHFDFDGWWEQKRIERGRRMDERTQR